MKKRKKNRKMKQSDLVYEQEKKNRKMRQLGLVYVKRKKLKNEAVESST